MLVRNGTHHRTDGQTVEVVVNENQAAQQDRCQLCAHAALDVRLCPTAECSGAAGFVHQTDHGAQHHQEHQNAHVVAVGQHGNNAVGEHMDHGTLKGEVGVQQTAHQNTDEQRGVHFLRNQCQSDCNHGRQQCPHRVVEMAGAFAGLKGRIRSKCRGAHQAHHQHQNCQNRQHLAQSLIHNLILSFFSRQRQRFEQRKKPCLCDYRT